MLTEEQITVLRGNLEKDRDRLIENARRAMGFTMDRDRSRIGKDSLDQSVEEWLYGTELRLHDREKYLLTKIISALSRLDEGNLDECEDCDEMIGYPRLLARPVTSLCIQCKEEREEKESQFS